MSDTDASVTITVKHNLDKDKVHVCFDDGAVKHAEIVKNHIIHNLVNSNEYCEKSQEGVTFKFPSAEIAKAEYKNNSFEKELKDYIQTLCKVTVSGKTYITCVICSDEPCDDDSEKKSFRYRFTINHTL